MPDLQTQLRQYGQELDHQYPDVGFDELLERVQPSRPHPSTTRRGLAIALAAVVVVILLIGGAALLNLFGGAEPPVATLPEPTTTSVAPITTVPSGVELPEPTEVESVETSLGRWTWRHFEGSLSELEELAPPPSRLHTDPPTPADTPAPAIDGVEWHSGGAAAASLNGVTVTAVDHFGRVNWPIQLGENPNEWWDLAARKLFISTNGGDRELTIHVVRGTPDAVEFRNSATEEVLARLEVTDPMAVAEQLTGEASLAPYWGPVLWSLMVDDGESSWIEPPWQGRAIDFVKVVSTPDDLVLVAVGRPSWEEPNRSSILWAWRSDNGRSWDPLGEPVQIEEIANQFEVAVKHDQVVALLNGDDAHLVVLVDGTHWEVVQAGFEGLYDTYGFGSVSWGWVLAGFRHEQEATNSLERCEVRISADGMTWERVVAPDITSTNEVSAISCYLSGDQVVALWEIAQDVGDLWIGSLED